MILRDYQKEAVDAVFDYFENNQGNALLDLPTGSGKSVIIAELCRRIFQYPNMRVLCLTHVMELIQQNYERLQQVWPGNGAGIYSAGVGRRDVFNRLIFCGIQSVYKKANLFAPVDLIIIDECHLLSPNREGMYQHFITELLQHNPKMRVLGLTATPFRTGDGLLTEGNIFDEVVYSLPITTLIERGYLAPLISKGGIQEADMSKVKITAGEYNTKGMALAFDRDELTKAAVKEIVQYGQDRKKWLIFGSSIEHCYHIEAELKLHGITTGVITGKTDKEERAHTLKRYQYGDIKCLINLNVLTVGFDAPQTDLIALLRATKSTGLYIQILGRGMRIAPNKDNCLILDYGGNIERFGPVDKICITPKVQRDGTVRSEVSVQPTKLCPECRHDSHVKSTTCAVCGYQWPLELNHDSQASSAAILSIDIPEQKIEVKDIFFYRHKKAGKPDSMKVTYIPMGNLEKPLSEWVPFESFRKKAIPWWDEMAGTIPPLTTDEALERTNEIEKPEFVYFKKEGKYNHVTRRTKKRRDEAES